MATYQLAMKENMVVDGVQFGAGAVIATVDSGVAPGSLISLLEQHRLADASVTVQMGPPSPDPTPESANTTASKSAKK